MVLSLKYILLRLNNLKTPIADLRIGKQLNVCLNFQCRPLGLGKPQPFVENTSAFILFLVRHLNC